MYLIFFSVHFFALLRLRITISTISSAPFSCSGRAVTDFFFGLKVVGFTSYETNRG